MEYEGEPFIQSRFGIKKWKIALAIFKSMPHEYKWYEIIWGNYNIAIWIFQGHEQHAQFMCLINSANSIILHLPCKLVWCNHCWPNNSTVSCVELTNCKMKKIWQQCFHEFFFFVMLQIRCIFFNQINHPAHVMSKNIHQ